MIIWATRPPVQDSAVAIVGQSGLQLADHGVDDVLGPFADDQVAEPLVDQGGGRLDELSGFFLGRPLRRRSGTRWWPRTR